MKCSLVNYQLVLSKHREKKQRFAGEQMARRQQAKWPGLDACLSLHIGVCVRVRVCICVGKKEVGGWEQLYLNYGGIS